MKYPRGKLQNLTTYEDRVVELTKSRKKIKKKKMKQISDDDPDEPTFPRCIVSYILSKLPPELLLEKFRFICKLWNEIISIELKPKPSSNMEPQLILQTEKFGTYTLHLVETNIDEGDGELQRSHWKFCERRIGKVLDCCHGLLLSRDLNRDEVLHVTNPLTNEDTKLPICPSGCSHGYKQCSCSLVFDSSANLVKVVHIVSAVYGFEIFSVGVDEDWRQILGPYDINFSWKNPVCVNAIVMHWRLRRLNYTISMDARDEKLQNIILPVSNVNKIKLFEMGGFLSAIFFTSEAQVEIWSLENFTTKTWTKRHIITTSSIRNEGEFSPRLHKLKPLACFRNGEVILFRKWETTSHYALYTYDIISCKMKKLKMRTKHNQEFLVYVRSLISWKPSGAAPTTSERKEDVSEDTAASRMVTMANRFGALDLDSE